MWSVSGEQDCMLASFLIGRGKGQYEYAPARAHAMMRLNWKITSESTRNECVRRGTVYFVQNFHGNVIGELSPITSSSKSFFSLYCYHVATLNCQ